MRKKVQKTKTAGYDYEQLHMNKRLRKSSQTQLKANAVTIDEAAFDKNQIKMPDRVAEQVILNGSTDYRPRLYETTSNIIQNR